MQIRLPDPNIDFNLSISQEDQIFLSGSCFVDEIGVKLLEYKFQALKNPFGIVYNPAVLAAQLSRLMEDRPVIAEELIFDQGLWHSLWHHGQFSSTDKGKVVEKIRSAHLSGRRALLNARYIFLTLGSSYVYWHRGREILVSNCHRIPARDFDRFQLTMDEVLLQWKNVLKDLFRVNPDVEVIFTVSPVRHLRDGLIENNRSKALLLLLCAELEGAHKRVHYLPVYEYVIDVLRDYRFFDRDLTHPNALAVDLIWDWFGRLFFSEKTNECLEALEKVRRAAAHRPLYDNPKALRAFALDQIKHIEDLQTRFPFLDLKQEKAHFNSMLDA